MSSVFRARLMVNRSRVQYYDEKNKLEIPDEVRDIIKQFLKTTGTFTVLIEPGSVKTQRWKRESVKDDDLIDFGDEALVVRALILMRRMGALRVLAVETLLHGEWRHIDSLSSGQLTLFIGLMILASTIENDSVVLIDEPEISLHPGWQKKYCELLYKIAEYHKNCYFIVATHSPIIISEVNTKISSIFNLGEEIDGLENEYEDEKDNAEGKELILPTNNIEQVFATYFDTLTPNSFIVKSTVLRAIKAYEEKNSPLLIKYQKTLRSIRDGVNEKLTVDLIDEILDRSIK